MEVDKKSEFGSANLPLRMQAHTTRKKRSRVKIQSPLVTVYLERITHFKDECVSHSCAHMHCHYLKRSCHIEEWKKKTK